ncbi:MAG TPA: SufD family Fe-S cluster assembly protein [bacterium]|nr:SufD family Fe-S cluster assembly protein [bacterium]
MKEEYKKLEEVGYDTEEKERAGSFVQEDNNVLLAGIKEENLEISSIENALEKYPEVKEKYFGKAFEMFNIHYDKNTKGGYFIRVKKGKKVLFPVQACLILKTEKFKQKVHNIIIVEEGAELYLINGCTSLKAANEAYHLGISEFFIHKGGFLNFTMLHSWKKDVEVEPKSVAVVEEGGVFISNYMNFKPVKKIVMYPTAILKGKNSRVRFNSIVVGFPDCYQDIGNRVIFAERATSAEVISRAISLGGTVISRGNLKAISPQVKGHLECKGLVLSERGKIIAIPELETDFQDVELSHEAAIGKIRKEEIEYLASRGIPEEEAQSIIIRGFMNTEILGLPEVIKNEIDKITSELTQSPL